MDWQAGISHTPIPAVSLSRRLQAVNTCRHRILDSVKTADYILPHLKDIARIVNAVSYHNLLNVQGFKWNEGVQIIFTEQQYEDIFSLLCLEQ